MDGDDALPDGASLRDRPTAYAAVVVIACDRVKYLTRTVESIARAVASSPDPKKTREEFPLFISQDGDDARTTTYARTLEGKFYHVRHRQERLPKLRDGDSARHRAYYRISAHYKHALGRLFDDLGYERVVILEDDMDLAPDFFAYFRRLGDVLERDPSVYAISSWNDNGQKSLVKDERRLYRSDFFPGLGWMMHARLWKELRPKWPDAYWDDWMRQSAVRLGRETIRPEVCRTFNFGEKGASEGQWYKTHLANVKLASEKVDWGNEDLSYLDADAYERAVAEAVDAATPARDPSQITRAEITNPKGVFKVLYKDEAEFRRLAAKFHVFPEWKDGVPRGGYRGVVHLKMNDGRHEVMLVPRDAAKVTKTFAEYLASVDGGKAEVLGL